MVYTLVVSIPVLPARPGSAALRLDARCTTCCLLAATYERQGGCYCSQAALETLQPGTNREAHREAVGRPIIEIEKKLQKNLKKQKSFTRLRRIALTNRNDGLSDGSQI